MGGVVSGSVRMMTAKNIRGDNTIDCCIVVIRLLPLNKDASAVVVRVAIRKLMTMSNLPNLRTTSNPPRSTTGNNVAFATHQLADWLIVK